MNRAIWITAIVVWSILVPVDDEFLVPVLATMLSILGLAVTFPHMIRSIHEYENGGCHFDLVYSSNREVGVRVYDVKDGRT